MAIDLSPLTAALTNFKDEGPAEISMVVYPHNSQWYWRIEVDGDTVEDCVQAHTKLTDAVRDARQAHIYVMSRYTPAQEG